MVSVLAPFGCQVHQQGETMDESQEEYRQDPWPPFAIGEAADGWIEEAVAAWRVWHPEEGDAATAGLWVIYPGNTLSSKDPRPDVHSLHHPSRAMGLQWTQGDVDHCFAATRELFAEVIGNGCRVERIK